MEVIMKDRVYMVLAFIGLIILCGVYVLNYEGNSDNAIFEPDSYYQPAHSATGENAVLLYSQMTGARSVTCPQTSIKSSTSAIFINTTSKYGAKCFFLPDSDINMSKWDISGIDGCIQSAHKDDSSCTLGEFINTSGEFNSLVTDTYMIPTKEWNDKASIFEFEEEPTVPVYTFVAPFDFKFDNSNSEQGRLKKDVVIIKSNNGLCRITLEGVANWCCAGDVGVPRTVHSGTGNDVLEWYQHINGPHNTIYGNTGNATVKGGVAGNIVAYITADTKITFEKYNGNTWTSLSIYNFFHE